MKKISFIAFDILFVLASSSKEEDGVDPLFNIASISPEGTFSTLL